ncbi:hypothetical protein C1879_00355 [Paraeggerthella hongkongensis]|uniref:nucleotide-binding protein n=1 Tax=unclassified Paraeggerthella TaxID=2641972 RepID=UPI000DF74DC1|nr:ParA family protein [Paraeggerthella sp. Marseille-Q4926]MDY3981823.1 ParA family protein [Paraeggerthella sp.]RDB60002.1 hypothetical protein C1879_00355 [Paraeggerthella hongkongensis]
MSAQRYAPDASVVVVCGHYGVGKTNFSLNLAFDARERGVDVTLVDLDVVNPYFRSSDYRALLEERGISVIAPVMAGTTLDSPSLSGAVGPAVESARKDDGRERLLIIDAGGDDVGATALGRFAGSVAAAPYEMLYVVNRSRNLTQDPAEAVDVLREVEEKCHLRATAIVNNTHLKQDTDEATVRQGVPFAQAVAEQAGLPLACTTVPISLADRKTALFGLNDGRQTLYPVQVYVRTPWE